MNEFERLDGFAVRPATAEIDPTIESIVEGARVVKILGEQRLEGGPVLRHVRLVASLSNRRVRGCRSGGALSRHEFLLCCQSPSRQQIGIDMRTFLRCQIQTIAQSVLLTLQPQRWALAEAGRPRLAGAGDRLAPDGSRVHLDQLEDRK